MPDDEDILRLRSENHELRERAARAETKIEQAEQAWRIDTGQKVVDLEKTIVSLEKTIQMHMSLCIQREEFEMLHEKFNTMNLKMAGWSGGIGVLVFIGSHFWK